VRLAMEIRHTLQDCLYLAVALRLDSPLVTADSRSTIGQNRRSKESRCFPAAKGTETRGDACSKNRYCLGIIERMAPADAVTNHTAAGTVPYFILAGSERVEEPGHE